MQRYTAYAKFPSGPTTKFFVGSPSSYLYYDTARPIPQQNGVDVSSTVCTTNDACTFRYVTPSGCSGFNDWKYGLDARPASAPGNAATLRARYIAADVTYMAGSQDTGSADGSCGANVQGSGRLQCALTYAAYDRKYLATAKNRQVVITKSAHDEVCVTKTPAVAQVYLS
ncbi:hypothetical protein Poli38472_007842 [Pythium oligandrum]|uniref:Uncharacterized protein n=1 Tax=Pythium oligandrum TaxID=41045 RepID=A0A8K1CRF0_PYTOL|nr:hypothetical protein Poli38472_007842 [Pythium oligandrum]|eukprot:TMW68170.1 hypothetical protein Poli38472_007842 [Pythium oligandrum]